MYTSPVMFKLIAEKREAGKSVEALRKGGFIPSVLYGAGTTAQSISVSLAEFKRAWKEAGESSPVTLTIDGKEYATLIHDIQLDPVMGTPRHVDFLAIDLKKKVTVHVELEFTGIAPAIKDGLGSLVKVLHEVEIEALPTDLPHSLSVDISTLVDLEKQIHVRDIVVPNGVTILTSSDDVVALVAAAKEEKEEEVPVDLSTIEVEQKGKKPEEGEGAEAPAEESKE